MNARKLFTVAAVFNLLVGVPMLVAYPVVAKLLALQGPPTAWFHIAGAVVVLFGYVYWKIARDPAQFRPFVMLGIIAKMLFVVVIYGHWLAGDLSGRVALLVTVDLVFALLFAAYLRRSAAAAYARSRQGQERN
jgi:FtsH-binding integral membrane protein